MDDIRKHLEAWKKDGMTNASALEAGHGAILLLLAKVEKLEKQIKDLEENNKVE
jgi:hypothetical protein